MFKCPFCSLRVFSLAVRFEIRHIVIASLDEGCIAGLKSQEDEDIHYASVTVAGSSQGETGWKFTLTSVCSLQLEMYFKYMTMNVFPGTDRLKTKHANPEVSCKTPSFIDCHLDFITIHVLYMFLIYLKSNLVYLNIYRCWTENLQSSTQILKQSELCHWELHIYIFQSLLLNYWNGKTE